MVCRDEHLAQMVQAEEPPCGLRKDHAGAGQSQYVHVGSVVRGSRSGAGPALEAAQQVPVHTAGHELAEPGGVRVELPDATVSAGSSDRGPGRESRAEVVAWFQRVEAHSRLKSIYLRTIN